MAYGVVAQVGLLLLSVSGVTITLGTWQILRFGWKNDLIDTRTRRLNEEAAPLDQLL